MKLLVGVLAAALAIGVAALLVAGPSSGWSSGPAAIVLDDVHFEPNRLDAKVGVPLTVRLRNEGSEQHDLSFPSFHMPGLEGVESILAPGETRLITVEFDESGTHTFICSLAGHAAAGMTGAVYVSP